jgi:hypothetical protein
VEIKGYQKSVSQEKKFLGQEKQGLMSQLEAKSEEMSGLQHQLDEAKGEILVMRKRHETSLRVS